jgi:galactokinase/mevalonate kinase-like predicted kinase
MATADAEKQKVEITNEMKRFEKFEAFMVVLRSELPEYAKVMTTTWVMKKKKMDDELCRRLNARGFKQMEVQHFYSKKIAALSQIQTLFESC